jgi:hypothetical protein
MAANAVTGDWTSRFWSTCTAMGSCLSSSAERGHVHAVVKKVEPGTPGGATTRPAGGHVVKGEGKVGGELVVLGLTEDIRMLYSFEKV